MQALPEAATANLPPPVRVDKRHHLELALSLSRAGFYVFPAREADARWQAKNGDGSTREEVRHVKSPYSNKDLGLTRGCLDATRDPAVIKKWWAKWPFALVAIACGPSGIVVLDPDRHGPLDGVTAWEELKSRHDYDVSFCSVTLTANDGLHIIFKTPKGTEITNSPGALDGTGIDVRGNGGYVIAQGSVLPDGRMWRSDPGHIPLVDIARTEDLPELPAFLIKLISQPRAAHPVKANGEQRPTIATTDSRGRALARKALAEAEDYISSLTPGSDRSTKLFARAADLGSMAARGWTDEAESRAVLRRACEKNGLIADYSESKFEGAFTNGFAKGSAEPHADLEHRPLVKANGAAHPMQNDAPPPAPPPAEVPPSEYAGRYRVTEPDIQHDPTPLMRPIAAAVEFPLSALGETLEPAARGIIDLVKAPPSLAASSLLAVSSLAVQTHANVFLPAPGMSAPTSLFLMPIAESGDRKSKVDGFAKIPVEEFEQECSRQHAEDYKEFVEARELWEFDCAEAKKQAKGDRNAFRNLRALVGPEPEPPLAPASILDAGATIEGLFKAFREGRPSLAMLSDEAGEFVGGHATSDKAIIRSLAGLNKNWDGTPLRRNRASEAPQRPLFGRRLTFGAMVQPSVVEGLLSNPLAKGSGFLARFLKSRPDTLQGTRFQTEPDAASRPAIAAYSSRILELLRSEPNYIDGPRSGLNPRVLKLTPAATSIWLDLADQIERELKPGSGKYAPVKEFGAKLLEHITRIAGVLAVVDDPDTMSIDLDVLERAATIGAFFIEEELRITNGAAVPPELQRAEKLRVWLNSYDEDFIGASHLLTHGPSELRTSSLVREAIGILVNEGWLTRANEPAPLVRGKPVKEAWRIVREPTP